MSKLKKTEINTRKDSIIVDGYIFRKDRELKCGAISWRCTANRKKVQGEASYALECYKMISEDL